MGRCLWASPGLLGPISPPQRPAQRGSETLCRQGADSRCPWFHLPRGRSSTFSLGGSFQQVPFSRLRSRFHITTEIPGPMLGTLQTLLQGGVQPQPWGPHLSPGDPSTVAALGLVGRLQGRCLGLLLGREACWWSVSGWPQSRGPHLPSASPQPLARVGCPLHALHSTWVLLRGTEAPAVSGPALSWRIRSS